MTTQVPKGGDAECDLVDQRELDGAPRAQDAAQVEPHRVVGREVVDVVEEHAELRPGVGRRRAPVANVAARAPDDVSVVGAVRPVSA